MKKLVFDKKQFAKDVYEKRVSFENKLTLRQLSDMLKISFSSISRIENQVGIPELNTLMALCDWLDTNPGKYFLKISET